jgi:hypothetical protein
MDTVMEPQVAPEVPAVEKKPKAMSKVVRFGVPVLIVALVGYFGYTQHWFSAGTEKAKEMLSTVMPAPAASTQAAATPAQTPAVADETLSKARQSFASGDVQGAVNGYREVLAKNPEDVNAMGELGNVLFTMGWIQQATQTYFDAANKALDQNNPQVAQSLLPVIMRSNPILAGELQNRLFDLEAQQMDAQMQAQDQAEEKQAANEAAQAPQAMQSEAQTQALPPAAAPQAQHG